MIFIRASDSFESRLGGTQRPILTDRHLAVVPQDENHGPDTGAAALQTTKEEFLTTGVLYNPTFPI